jgi:Cu/Ag efflux protein CusF
MLFRSLILGLAPIFMAGCVTAHPVVVGDYHPANPSAPIGQLVSFDLPSSPHKTKTPAQLVHGGHEDAEASGKLNSVDVAGRKVNISHQPISSIGWPAMTMDFPVASTVDLSALKPGGQVAFTLDKDEDGMYQIQSIKPVTGQ